MRTWLAVILTLAVALLLAPPAGAGRGPAPLAEATPTPAPTATPQGYDPYEPNDTPDQAVRVGVGATVDATLHIGDPADWWRVQLKAGRTYRLEAIALEGDPMLALYDGSAALAVNRDCAPGTLSACLTFAPTLTGDYLIEVATEVPGLFCAYRLRITEVLPTPVPTPTASATPVASATPPPTPTPNDPFEPNSSFETAADLIIGRTVEAYLDPGDIDIFRLYARTGASVRCDVQPKGNVDPRLTVYTESRQPLGTSDARGPGDPGAAFAWLPGYTGWHYLRIDPIAGAGAYAVGCFVVPPTPTIAPTPISAAAQPPVPAQPPAPTPTPFLLPTPTPRAEVAPASGTPHPDPTPRPAIGVVVYFDANNDRAASPDEGIAGATVLLLDPATNRVVMHGRTDAFGALTFHDPVGGSRPLRVSIPYLAFSKLVRPGDVVEVRIASLRLPGLIP